MGGPDSPPGAVAPAVLGGGALGGDSKRHLPISKPRRYQLCLYKAQKKNTHTLLTLTEQHVIFQTRARGASGIANDKVRNTIMNNKFVAEVNGSAVELSDPKPAARQILFAARCRPEDEHVLIRLTPGSTNSVGLDELVDLHEEGPAKFRAFKSAEIFRFTLDGRGYEWGEAKISGGTLKELAEVNPNTYGVWLEVRGADDRPIGDGELANLSREGLERFFTGTVQTTEG